MRARACIKCREYVIVRPEDPTNQELVKVFEGKHRGHTLITLDLDEVKASYSNFASQKNEESEDSSD